eukprot:PhM_4_TR8040/c0_g4_i1/m.103666
MGCKQSNTRRDAPTHTQQLDANWLPFLDGKTQVEFKSDVKAVMPFKSHAEGQAWSESALRRIDAGLKSRGLAGSYDFKQSGEPNGGGFIVLTCSTRNHAGANRHFSWTMRYVVET